MIINLTPKPVISLFIVFALSCSSCCNCKCKSGKISDQRSVELIKPEFIKQKAIEIAKAEMKKRETSAADYVYEVKLIDEFWYVLAIQVTGYDAEGKPKYSPGAQILIKLNKNGNVILVSGGY